MRILTSNEEKKNTLKCNNVIVSCPTALNHDELAPVVQTASERRAATRRLCCLILNNTVTTDILNLVCSDTCREIRQTETSGDKDGKK